MLSTIISLRERYCDELIFGVISVHVLCTNKSASTSELLQTTKPRWSTLHSKFGVETVSAVATSIERVVRDEITYSDSLRLLTHMAKMEEVD